MYKVNCIRTLVEKETIVRLIQDQICFDTMYEYYKLYIINFAFLLHLALKTKIVIIVQSTMKKNNLTQLKKIS